MARPLLASVNADTSGTSPVVGGCHSQALWSHRYRFGCSRTVDPGCAVVIGCCSGQSARRSAGGLMTAQFANDMVRDQRNKPLLLVRLNEPFTTSNHEMKATTDTAPPASTAHTRRQPARRISR